MKPPMIALSLLLVSGAAFAADADTAPAWREDFSKVKQNSAKRFMPEGWEYKGKAFTNDVVFDVADDKPNNRKVLRMVSDKASGTFLREVSGVDLNKYPLVRWCWRAKRLPPGADGRPGGKDDQAIGLYIGTGRLSQESIAYRWESETPKNDSGKVSYGGGFVKVQWNAVRNKDDAMNEWFVETRNIRDDFKAAYGSTPTRFAISVSSNSQYTKSLAEAELAWIEFLPLSVLEAEKNAVVKNEPPTVSDTAPSTDSAKVN